jgi:hypothetical protein
MLFIIVIPYMWLSLLLYISNERFKCVASQLCLHMNSSSGTAASTKSKGTCAWGCSLVVVPLPLLVLVGVAGTSSCAKFVLLVTVNSLSFHLLEMAYIRKIAAA